MPLVEAVFVAFLAKRLQSEHVFAQLSGTPRVREALRVLVDDGLATQLGELVGVSRAAVRFRALGTPS